MLEAAVRNNGLESYFSAIISVDQVKTYKPSPKVYQLGPQTLGFQAHEILFVSSNGGQMDSVLAGAAIAGLVGVAINAILALIDHRLFGWRYLGGAAA